MILFLGSFHIWGLAVLSALHFSSLVNKAQCTSAGAPESYFTQFCNWSYTTTREKRFTEGRDFITNGTRVYKGTYQFNVLLYMILKDGLGKCTGSILDEYHILTAAHCVVYESRSLLGEEYDLILLNSTGDRRLRGIIAYTAIGEDADRLTSVWGLASSVYVHSAYTLKYEPFPTVHGRDIAVIRLRTPLEFGDNVRPVCLASPTDELTVPAECTVFGYGNNGTNLTLDENKNTGLYLLYADGLNVYTPEQRRNNQTLADWIINFDRNRRRNYGQNDTEIEAIIETNGLRNYETEDMFAFVGESGEGICSGDSGGPLMCKVKNSSSKYMKQFAINEAKIGKCGVTETIMMFESVQHHLDWLEFVALPTLNPSNSSNSKGKEPEELFLMCKNELDWKRLLDDIVNSGKVNRVNIQVLSILATDNSSWVNIVCRSYVAYLTCRDHHHTPAACDKMKPVMSEPVFGKDLVPYFTELLPKDTTTPGHTVPPEPKESITSMSPGPTPPFSSTCFYVLTLVVLHVQVESWMSPTF